MTQILKKPLYLKVLKTPAGSNGKKFWIPLQCDPLFELGLAALLPKKKIAIFYETAEHPSAAIVFDDKPIDLVEVCVERRATSPQCRTGVLVRKLKYSDQLHLVHPLSKDIRWQNCKRK